jgi:hypothetical protein
VDAVTLRKLMIVPWVGPLPDWTAPGSTNGESPNAGYGWEFLLDVDEHRIRERIEALGVRCPPLAGRKLCDYRPAFGEMYADEIQGFDFWGHTDLDCVYGRLWDYITDELLAGIDVYSNDPYPQMCGPFTLYRASVASSVFRAARGWRTIFEDPEHHAFDETGIADAIAARVFVSTTTTEGEDSMYVHFTSSKTYPHDLPASFLP